MLEQEAWTEVCLEQAVPSDAIWANDGKRAYALHPARCGDDPVMLTIIDPDRPRPEVFPTSLKAQDLGIAASMVWTNERLVITGGSVRCSPPGQAGPYIYEMNAKGEILEKTWDDAGFDLWNALIFDGERVLGPAFSSFTSTEGYLNQSYPSSTCRVFYPHESITGKGEWCQDSEPEGYGQFHIFKMYAQGRKSRGKTPTFNVGRPTTYAYQPKHDRFVRVGGLKPTPQPNVSHFKLSTSSLAAHRFRVPRVLPETPLIGDGITLLATSSGALLLDPLGTHSYLLEEDDAYWKALPQSSLSELIPTTQQLNLENVPEILLKEKPKGWHPKQRKDTRSPVKPAMRFTHSAWPYFAYYHKTLEAAVVIPYQATEKYCLPLESSPDVTACLKAHP